MAIVISENKEQIALHTEHTTYQLRIDPRGFLQHLYYGARIPDADLGYLWQHRDRPFSGIPQEAGEDRTISFDTMPLEYPGLGCGDYREPCLEVRNGDGSCSVDLRYEGCRILEGKPSLPGLPAVHAGADEAETLELSLRDRVSGVRAVLLYSVLPREDVITRSVRIENTGSEPVTLQRVLSCCLDFQQPCSRDLITFQGRHAGERTLERTPLSHGSFRIGSTRGATSHHYNNGVILCDRDTTETAGDCCAMLFVYSGNFLAEAEVDQVLQTRLVMGIHPRNFNWELKPGASFQAPEVVMTFSAQGLEAITNHLHGLINRHIIRGKYAHRPRPILLNSWEAAYFDYDEEKLLEIARGAAELGTELFVLDDGWFGRRNSDTTSLGDWEVNEQKIRCGLPELCRKINGLGLKFGIWIEPEMISLESRLYEEHPDWVLKIPGRAPVSSRCQYVLDLSREDVVEHLFQVFSRLLSSCNIEYVKWDMNRQLSDIWSCRLPEHRQGEVLHRYVLGVYALMERLTGAFPEVLLENCSGGGGRFDAGMLYYSPQIWTSDNTDPIERLTIQYGTSFLYPSSCMSAHVSASPNHQTHRSTSMKTRGIVARTGSFGYELDPGKLTVAEKEEIRSQIRDYRENWELYSFGAYYRLLPNPVDARESAWMQVSGDRKKAVVSYVVKNVTANAPTRYLKLRGLNPETVYEIPGWSFSAPGAVLMNVGLPMPELYGDYPAISFLLTAIE